MNMKDFVKEIDKIIQEKYLISVNKTGVIKNLFFIFSFFNLLRVESSPAPPTEFVAESGSNLRGYNTTNDVSTSKVVFYRFICVPATRFRFFFLLFKKKNLKKKIIFYSLFTLLRV